MNNASTKVIVGLSGGVDSSVAALSLVRQGYTVEGLFMKNWEEDDTGEYCAATEDLADASAVAEHLGIPLHTVNFATEYWDRVFEYFLAEYRAGRTPNPDVLCNKEIKFRAFLDHALDLGADLIATGHYAARSQSNDQWELRRALDDDKDQTYFLHLLNQHQIEHSLFPLARLPKSEVRRLAEEAGFVTHDKKDSTGICFIGERRFKDFLEQYLPASPGDIQKPGGKVIGHHQGLMYYTIGQRQGLGIGGVAGSDESPWFVARKDLENNILVAVQGHDHPLLFANALDASRSHWISGEPPSFPLRCEARCRHRQPLQSCTVAADGSKLRVLFDESQRAITPGQSVVFYENQTCLGGAVIDEAIQTQSESKP